MAKLRLGATAAVALLFLGVAIAGGQPLADKLPADALVYLGWQGSQDLGPDYANSHLKAVVDASQISELFERLLPQVIQKIEQQDATAPPALGAVAELIPMLVKHPGAFYFGGVGVDALTRPTPLVALVCQAGPDAEALAQRLNNLLAQAKTPRDDSWEAGTAGDGLVYLADKATAQEIKTLVSGPHGSTGSLSQVLAFRAAMDKTLPQAVVAMYADAAGLLAMIDQQVAASHDPDTRMWPVVKQALGLDGIKQIAFGAGFAGRDWQSATFIAAPAPRAGILEMVEPRPPAPEVAQLIPTTAALATVGNFELAAAFARLHQALAQADPQVLQQFDQVLAQVRQMTGLDIETDLLAPLGRQWVVYTDRDVAGTGLLGLVVVNPLRDAAKAQASLDQLKTALNQIIAQQTQPGGPTVRFVTAQVQDVNISYLAVPFVTPAWAIVDGNLYLGLYPQTVVAAVNAARAKGPSIADNQALAELRDRLGAPPAATFTFIDVPQSAGSGYQTVLLASRLYLGLADMFGLEAPAMVVPTLAQLRPHLGPVAGFAWADDAGLYYKQLSPFPGAKVFGAQQDIMVGQQAMMIGILLPALGQARQAARQTQSQVYVRSLVLSAMTYLNDRGELPPDLTTMVREKLIPPEMLLGGTGRRPPGIENWPPDQQDKWVQDNSVYVYLGGNNRKPETVGDPSQQVLVFEKLSRAQRGTIAVGFYDGHAQCMPVFQAQTLVNQQTGKSLEEWSQPATGSSPAAPAPAAPGEVPF